MNCPTDTLVSRYARLIDSRLIRLAFAGAPVRTGEIHNFAKNVWLHRQASQLCDEVPYELPIAAVRHSEDGGMTGRRKPHETRRCPARRNCNYGHTFLISAWEFCASRL